MGGALLAGWQFMPMRFDVVEPHTPSTHAHTSWHKDIASLPAGYHPDIIVLAVKPQQMDAVLAECKTHFTNQSPLYLSIAAGKNLSYYHAQLGEHAHVVRAMPNTPALIGKGMSVLTARSTLAAAHKHTATQLMETVGKVEWVDESLMDAVTALSGSGPAYVFLFLDALTKAGVSAGLSEPLARTLALETVTGSCALAAHGHDSFEQLRKNVTSPGGTTEAALNLLMQEPGLVQLVQNAVSAAKKRSAELAAS